MDYQEPPDTGPSSAPSGWSLGAGLSRTLAQALFQLAQNRAKKKQEEDAERRRRAREDFESGMKAGNYDQGLRTQSPYEGQ